MSNHATVFVVDDDTALCEALGFLLKSDGLAVEMHNSASSFLKAYTPDRPGALLLDVRMRGMDGLDLQAHLASLEFEIPIIILTAHGDVPMAVQALKAGALEFLQKPINDQDLLDAIRRALRVDAENRRRRAAKAEIRARYATLTQREREVLKVLIAGLPSKQIAERLCVSEKTVEVHRKHVRTKMGASSTVELVRMVMWLHDGGDLD